MHVFIRGQRQLLSQGAVPLLYVSARSEIARFAGSSDAELPALPRCETHIEIVKIAWTAWGWWVARHSRRDYILKPSSCVYSWCLSDVHHHCKRGKSLCPIEVGNPPWSWRLHAFGAVRNGYMQFCPSRSKLLVSGHHRTMKTLQTDEEVAGDIVSLLHVRYMQHGSRPQLCLCVQQLGRCKAPSVAGAGAPIRHHRGRRGGAQKQKGRLRPCTEVLPW